MPNMSPNKVKMPEQDPNVRNKNFEEVSLGYTKEQAMERAEKMRLKKDRIFEKKQIEALEKMKF